MSIRFFLNPETGLPHIYKHNVIQDEVRDVLRNPFQELGGSRNSTIAFGQTRDGHYLTVNFSARRGWRWYIRDNGL